MEKMKNKLILVGALLALMLAGTSVYSSVNKNPESPSDALTAFHQNIMDGELEEAKEYISNDIVAAFESGSTPWFVGSFGDFVKEHQEKHDTIKPFSEVVKGDTATVEANVTYSDGSSEVKKYLLIKENCKWKIAE